MEQTISTQRLSLVTTEERKYTPDNIVENCKEIMEYEIFLSDSSSSKEIGYIIVCTLKESYSDNICLFYYEIKEKFRRKGYAFETISAILNTLPKGSVAFAHIVMVKNSCSEPEASKQLLLKLGFSFKGFVQFPLMAQYEKKL